MLGASTGPWCSIRTSSVCVCGHSLSPGRNLLLDCVGRHRKPQLHTLSHLTPGSALGYSMKGEGPLCGDLLVSFLMWEGVGIFPCPSRRNLSWPPLKARTTCFSSSSASPFLFVLCFQLWPAERVSQERGLFPWAGNIAAPKADCSFSPLLTSLWEQAELGLAHDRCPVKPCNFEGFPVWKGVCVSVLVGEYHGILKQENLLLSSCLRL